ncbi:MAG TPA: MIP/aquaporin family protein [Rhizomicrobium sp.]|jgi:glycerol uptake facilitator-like aquaporin
MRADLARRLAAEGLGTAFLLMAVVGSGIMGEKLAGGNAAIALLANSLATAAVLVAFITILGPISGAHFNPAVTLVAVIRRDLDIATGLGYGFVQVVCALAGVYATHLMFDLPVMQLSSKLRCGPAQMFSEFVATFGLIIVVAGGSRFRPSSVAALVGLYIGAAYWFTASTSFANPAVTLARAATNTFSGISPSSLPGFLTAQLVGALAGWAASAGLFGTRKASDCRTSRTHV